MARNFGFSSRKVDVSQFSMVPRSDVPRSKFRSQHTHKTTFDAGKLIPIYVDEILPGDSVQLRMTAFTRMSTPLFPVMDNLTLDTFFFFVPNRLLWDNFERFMGARTDPGDSVDYLLPVVHANATEYYVGSVADYMGIPILPGLAGRPAAKGEAGTMEYSGDRILTHSALPFRAYRLIWNEWFRDQNLQDTLEVPRDDGPDPQEYGFEPLPRGKRHDYFTSALPWPQKGEAVTLSLGDRAPIRGLGVFNPEAVNGQQTMFYETGQNIATPYAHWALHGYPEDQLLGVQMTPPNPDEGGQQYPEVYADLSEATAQTINAIRQAFQVQRLLERDARGGTRYTEILQSHFGVSPQDARLQRPEYLGGGSTPINITPVAQTSATDITGSSSPLAALGAVGMATAQNGFSQSFTEHGWIIGLANVRADITYQQGLHRMWSRRTRYDMYWPAFAHLGEQAILRQEIYAEGIKELDEEVFGYQERWAEYRHKPSRLSSAFRSFDAEGASGTLDSWHLAQYFAEPPLLNAAFIEDKPPLRRVLAAGWLAENQQFLSDMLFDIQHTRAMPTFSVPGFIDRF